MPQSGTAPPRLSLVIPIYQEAHRIAQTLHEAAAFLAEQPYSSEIVVADDGSRDGGFELSCEAGASLPVPLCVLRSAPNRGKGAALKLGFAAARGEVVAFPTPISRRRSTRSVPDSTPSTTAQTS